MSQYGIELYADTGFKFVIPDYSGFVFSHYQDFTLYTKNWDDGVFHSQAYPAGAQVAVFTRIIGRSAHPGYVPTVAYQDTGAHLNFTYIYYQSSLNPGDYVTVRLYFFYNKEVKSDNSAYGLRVFDEAGNVVFHTSSNPLRLQRTNWGFQDGWSVNTGHGVATLCASLGQRGQVQQQPFPQTHIYNVVATGEGTTLKAGLSYQNTIPTLAYVDRNLNAEVIYINTNYYD